ncbi:MAG: DUF1826 domain-containing protein [Pseudomonadales bacterium]|jgi:hypothetical protein|nr:DUF1826 domain-containing protein [Pseudomonadales bacterium]
MSRHLVTASPDDLPEILEPDVELVQLDFRADGACARFAEALLVPGYFEEAAFVMDPRQPLARHGAVPAVLREAPGSVEWCLQVDWIAGAFATLFDVRRLGLRLSHVRRPMCPRFHIDRVPCRVITTFAGAGTEWIPESEVDAATLARAPAELPPDAAPLRPQGRIRQLPRGSLGFFKGSGCDDARVRGVVHRSPPCAEPRLVMTLDLLA